MSDLQISNSFGKLRSFLIQITQKIYSKSLLKGPASALKFSWLLHYHKKELFIQVGISVKYSASTLSENRITWLKSVLFWDNAKL